MGLHFFLLKYVNQKSEINYGFAGYNFGFKFDFKLGVKFIKAYNKQWHKVLVLCLVAVLAISEVMGQPPHTILAEEVRSHHEKVLVLFLVAISVVMGQPPHTFPAKEAPDREEKVDHTPLVLVTAICSLLMFAGLTMYIRCRCCCCSSRREAHPPAQHPQAYNQNGLQMV
ncbi:uncharacterized protein [Spinacia oleracea]|uniref:PGG domain-containing protein n=1 Tax=Spinacia oleracea TaxID=3562 RepID=A0ABM3RGU4_SPIOL|nr:uncharacterized protein LOC130469518 [Spinacia oleracea]